MLPRPQLPEEVTLVQVQYLQQTTIVESSFQPGIVMELRVSQPSCTGLRLQHPGGESHIMLLTWQPRQRRTGTRRSWTSWWPSSGPSTESRLSGMCHGKRVQETRYVMNSNSKHCVDQLHLQRASQGNDGDMTVNVMRMLDNLVVREYDEKGLKRFARVIAGFVATHSVSGQVKSNPLRNDLNSVFLPLG